MGQTYPRKSSLHITTYKMQSLPQEPTAAVLRDCDLRVRGDRDRAAGGEPGVQFNRHLGFRMVLGTCLETISVQGFRVK